MKKIFIYILTIGFINTGCQKFLDITPSEGGIAGFTNVSQFDALFNEIRVTRNRYEWNHAIYASDDCFFHPDWQTASSTYQQAEAFNLWTNAEYRNLTGNTNGFQSAWGYMYPFNYITDKIDNPAIEGSDLIKKALKGEAMFWRAFYYFNLVVQYAMHPALNNGSYPGLAYKNTISTDPSTYSDRKTVKYTMDGILSDLEAAEQLLKEGGKTDFNVNQPWRASAVTVQALRARVELYAGNYPKAFENARKAYQAYNFIYDMNNTSLFGNVNRTQVTATCSGQPVSFFTQSPQITALGGNTLDANGLWFYKEQYFRFVCQVSAMPKLPPSQDLYSLYASNDLRKRAFYDNNLNAANSPFTACRRDELISKNYMKHANTTSRSAYVLGVSVPEIMLIMAECRARGAGDGENASVILRELRRRRFPTGFADNIGGSIKDVKEERRRELAFVMRWYDLKRYNALDNENITITKVGRRDVYNVNSDIVTYKLAPNGLAYAQPIPEVELLLLKTWPQNEDGGVTKQ